MDLRTLFVLCVQAVSSDELRTENKLLKKIREHFHLFANGLEARMGVLGIKFIQLFHSNEQQMLTY